MPEEKKEAIHTPGPWISKKMGERYYIDVDNSAPPFNKHQGIASVHVQMVNAEANAYLISSAPDLLKSLEHLAGLADGRVNGDDNDEMGTWAEALLEAQEAIRKAKAFRRLGR